MSFYASIEWRLFSHILPTIMPTEEIALYGVKYCIAHLRGYADERRKSACLVCINFGIVPFIHL